MYASDLKHPNPTLEDKLHHLYGLNREKTIDLSFRPPFLNLLAGFGNPQNHLPPVIHVAGTNGKGSIIAYLKAMLEAQGKTVHGYTSPHLQRFNERIVLAGHEIEDKSLEALIDEALVHNASEEVTFFEITTAMAMAAFARVPADFTLLEVGLGGRLDCTNVVERPALTIINAIGYDHTEYLGETLLEIAAEKAGIMKAGVPCIIGPQTKEAVEAGVLDIFQARAEELDTPLIVLSGDESYDSALIGQHQKSNAAVAIKALELLGLADQKAIEGGLKNVSWRARLQDVSNGFDVPEGWQIYLDGGHNEHAAQALAKWILESGEPIHLVLGMMKHKDPLGYLGPLLPHIRSLSLVPIPGDVAAHSAESLGNILYNASLGGECEPNLMVIKGYHDFGEAIKELTTHHKSGRILIGGSLYLAGHVLDKISK